ncbi:hypothetical protein ANN_11643 [Periplaneta americana]|uniref:Tc1-like transposase DDE domain-containing protein n=1 Tax=Periplaneta americana TaxID=6978 RepID=A0ABQ8T7C7_PERAM|nr:hypothetical protein ANN_11643 [Periplaneta americana]
MSLLKYDTFDPEGIICEGYSKGIPERIWCSQSSQRNTILGLVNKLETTGSLVSEKGKHRSSRLPTVVVDTVNTAEYRLIFMEFVEQLYDVELSQGYFQQDGATCHTSNESMELIASFFDDRIISRNLWPPRSPDLTTPDFFLWGYLKDRVYATHWTI